MQENKFKIITFYPQTIERLDKVVKSFMPYLSRSQVINLIKNGFVKVGDHIVKKPGHLVKPCELVEVILEPKATNQDEFCDLHLDVLLEEERFFAVNKPAGISVHPGAGKRTVTVLDFLKKKLGDQYYDMDKGGLVHRLDKDTSGVLLCAKDKLYQQALSKLFQKRLVKKTYLALTHAPKNSLFWRCERGTITCWIKRDPANRLRFRCHDKEVSSSRLAITEFERLLIFANLAIMILRPITGRTHQLRASCLYVNCPIVNDKLYATNITMPPELNKTSLGQLITRTTRLMLHAYKIEFVDPVTGLSYKIKAPLPLEFRDILLELQGTEVLDN
ncbi:MAG: RluA family pseudouridine synthase [Deltaproteobacteria bacterium]|nr:RluA family pseudouridine synthase [Deltaproteobacteria bacterium]MCX7952989.1 RluA family pseudouridine synthase [Deltaproteobacteria bacterium]